MSTSKKKNHHGVITEMVLDLSIVLLTSTKSTIFLSPRTMYVNNNLSNYLTKNDTLIANQSFAVGLTTFEVTDKIPVVPDGYERVASILYTTQNYLFAQLAFVANDKVFLTVNNCHPSLSISSDIRCVQLYKRKI